MNIYIDGRLAVLKEGTSFDYISENRLFMGRDAYTFTISLPLKDCPDNIAIFGHIDRKDVAKGRISLPCEIRDRNLCISGAAIVTSVSEVEVKIQFAEGRCEQTATDPFKDVFVNELDLGEPKVLSASDIEPAAAWLGYDQGRNYVALPWVNTEYPLPPNNDAVYASDVYSWAKDTKELSWQPYLIFVAKKICEAIGYTPDFSAWETSDYRFLLVCNTLPAAWDMPGFASALPHWTVSEFFEKLELLLLGEFDFDHRSKTVGFSFISDILADTPGVKLDEVVDSYTVDISQDDSRCEYIGTKRLAYKDCGHLLSPYYDCGWFIRNWDEKLTYTYRNIAELIEANKLRIIENNGHKRYLWGDMDKPHRGTENTGVLLYAEAEKTYFVFRSIGSIYKKLTIGASDLKIVLTHKYVLQPVNVFGTLEDFPEDAQVDEIEFCPACVAETDDEHGAMMFLSFSTYDSAMNPDDAEPEQEATGDGVFEDDGLQPLPAATIVAGEKEKGNGFYDVVYVGFWDGSFPVFGKMPYPMVDSVNITQDWIYFNSHFKSLRLYKSSHAIAEHIPMIDPSQKFKFSFLADKIPDARAVFNIRGRRYVCEKITATFTERGMSRKMQGEFYPLAD